MTYMRTITRATRSLFMLVVVTMLSATPSALAERKPKHYDLYVRDAGKRFVGKTEFDYSYWRVLADDGDYTFRHIRCYDARITGTVKDTSKDGNSVKVYFESDGCGNVLGKSWVELGFAGKPEDPPDKFDYLANKVFNGVVHICTWTEKRGIISCTPGVSNFLRDKLNARPHSSTTLYLGPMSGAPLQP